MPGFEVGMDCALEITISRISRIGEVMKPSATLAGQNQKASEDKIPGKDVPGLGHHNIIRCQFKHSPIFGRFIEVDPLPEKTCPFDCLYCGKGKTIQKTVNSLEFYPHPDAFRELELLLHNNPAPDHIVIGGNGDPTICQNISLLIHAIHSLAKVPVAIISCGGLLWKSSVQSELSQADIVLASIDAPNKLIYQNINRPHQMVPYSWFLQGVTTIIISRCLAELRCRISYSALSKAVAADVRFNPQGKSAMPNFDDIHFLFTGLYKLILL